MNKFERPPATPQVEQRKLEKRLKDIFANNVPDITPITVEVDGKPAHVAMKIYPGEYAASRAIGVVEEDNGKKYTIEQHTNDTLPDPDTDHIHQSRCRTYTLAGSELPDKDTLTDVNLLLTLLIDPFPEDKEVDNSQAVLNLSGDPRRLFTHPALQKALVGLRDK